MISAAVLFTVTTAVAPGPVLDERYVEQDARLRFEADAADEVVRRSGVLIDDPELLAYLNAVADDLYPEFKDDIEVHVHRCIEANAFILANGSIYMCRGMLARIESEAQLASILAHEGAHHLESHVVRSALSAKGHSAISSIFMIAGPAGLVGSALAVSSYAGFSRGKERDADQVGFRRMVAAGYSPQAAVAVFARLHREAKVFERKDGGLFASHPRLRDRVESYQELAGDGEGEVGADRYLAAASAARLGSIAAMHERRDSRGVLFLLEGEKLVETFPVEANYYLGEALRIRGKEGDPERAAAAFEALAAARPDDPRGWKGLGMLHYRQGRYAAAIEPLEKFASIGAEDPDYAFGMRYLADAKRRVTEVAP